MDLSMLVITAKVANMARVSTHGKTVQNIRVPGMRTKFTEKECTNGSMEDATMVNGCIRICMGMESTPGKMDAATKESMSKTASMAMVSTNGLMVESMREIGRMEDNTVKDFTGSTRTP